MAEHRFQVALHRDSALPADDVENVLYFEVNAPDTVEGCCDGIVAAYTSLNGFWSAELNGHMTVKVYDIAGGQPTFIKQYLNAVTMSTAAAPAEVAYCLSYATVDDVEASTPRRRGRIYVGPWGSLASTGTTGRPGATAQDAVLDLGEALGSVGTAGNTTWLMYSRSDAVTIKIESIWVDDTWDTQRRRGSAPTARFVRDVQ